MATQFDYLTASAAAIRTHVIENWKQKNCITLPTWRDLLVRKRFSLVCCLQLADYLIGPAPAAAPILVALLDAREDDEFNVAITLAEERAFCAAIGADFGEAYPDVTWQNFTLRAVRAPFSSPHEVSYCCRIAAGLCMHAQVYTTYQSEPIRGGEPEQRLPRRVFNRSAPFFQAGQQLAAQQAEVLIDFLGAGYAWDARWLTADTVGLARGIHADCAWDRLSLLADALMDAGCGEEWLTRLKDGQHNHFRNSWILDKLLGVR